MGHEFDDRNLDAADRDNDSYYATHVENAVALCDNNLELSLLFVAPCKKYIQSHIDICWQRLERQQYYFDISLLVLDKKDNERIQKSIKNLVGYDALSKDIDAIQVHLKRISDEADAYFDSEYALSKSA
jgi:hypothetical protein